MTPIREVHDELLAQATGGCDIGSCPNGPWDSIFDWLAEQAFGATSAPFPLNAIWNDPNFFY